VTPRQFAIAFVTFLFALAFWTAWAAYGYRAQADAVEAVYRDKAAFVTLYGSPDVVVRSVEVTSYGPGYGIIDMVPPAFGFYVSVDATVEGKRVTDERLLATFKPAPVSLGDRGKVDAECVITRDRKPKWVLVEPPSGDRAEQ
jgi:hypothetical protein